MLICIVLHLDFGNFSKLGVISSLNDAEKLETKEKHHPDYCRFLSLVVVEHVLRASHESPFPWLTLSLSAVLHHCRDIMTNSCIVHMSREEVKQRTHEHVRRPERGKNEPQASHQHHVHELAGQDAPRSMLLYANPRRLGLGVGVYLSSCC